jgi:hypothetical protein
VENPGYDTTQHSHALKEAEPRAAARPSVTYQGGLGVSPGYGNPTRTHAENGQLERSGQVERSKEGGFRDLPKRLQSHSHTQADSNSEAQARQRRRPGADAAPETNILFPVIWVPQVLAR